MAKALHLAGVAAFTKKYSSIGRYHEPISRILDAHGGMDRWRDYEEATIVAGGGFYPLKGMTQDATPRRMTAWLHQEGFPAAQLTSDYIVADGIHFPSKRRA